MDVTEYAYIGASFLGILIALIAMGAVYRATRPPTIKGEVRVGYWEDVQSAISVSRHHMPSENHGKPARVVFKDTSGKKLLTKSLTITIEKADGSYTYGTQKENDAPGGRVCVDEQTFAELKAKMGNRDPREHAVALTFNYPSSANLLFLLKDHPDLAVKASAWIFLLTSVYGLFQWSLARLLGL